MTYTVSHILKIKNKIIKKIIYDILKNKKCKCILSW